VLTLGTSPQTFTVPFTDFMTTATQVNSAQSQVVALQWQIVSGPAMEDGGVQPSCTAEVRIDDIDFVP
jgi:hypothetical protein